MAGTEDKAVIISDRHYVQCIDASDMPSLKAGRVYRLVGMGMLMDGREFAYIEGQNRALKAERFIHLEAERLAPFYEMLRVET